MTMRNLPAGAIGFVKPTSLIGRIISKRQGIPYSHMIVALGNGKVLDSTVPYTRVTDEEYWEQKGRQVTWFVPSRPFSHEEARALRSVAYFVRDRIRYSIRALIMWVLRGVPGKRGHDLVCSYCVAEVYMVVRNLDLSGCEQPWNLDLREAWAAVVMGPFRRVAPSELG